MAQLIQHVVHALKDIIVLQVRLHIIHIHVHMITIIRYGLHQQRDTEQQETRLPYLLKVKLAHLEHTHLQILVVAQCDPPVPTHRQVQSSIVVTEVEEIILRDMFIPSLTILQHGEVEKRIPRRPTTQLRLKFLPSNNNSNTF